MNQLQQEIKYFHERLKPTLQVVLGQYGQETAPGIYRNIIKPCKRLVQKCSFKSVSDTSCLCSLAYWLYIYGNKALALKLCEIAHGADFSFEFEYWNNGIQNIYGLEIRIARELLSENRKDNFPPNLLEYYFSKRVRKRLKYPQVLREKEIVDCSSRLLNGELLNAIYDMIGKGETGLYTELNENWDEIEQAIKEYIDCLKEDEINSVC